MPRTDFIIVNVLAGAFIAAVFALFQMEPVNKFITMTMILIGVSVYVYMTMVKPRKKMNLAGIPSWYHICMSVYFYLIAFGLTNVLFSTNGSIILGTTICYSVFWLLYLLWTFKKCKDLNQKMGW